MNKFFYLKCVTLFGLLTFPLSSCSDNTKYEPAPQSETKLADVEFVYLVPDTLVGTSEGVSGSGKMAAKLPLGEIKDKKNLKVKTTLQDQGSVTLYAFANRELTQGLSIELKRMGSKLTVNLKKGETSTDISKSFAAIDASKEVHLLFDVHNDEEPAHLLAWAGETPSPSEDNALYNSEKESDGAAPGNGEGTYWGVQLSQAKVTLLAPAAPLFSEE